MEALSQLGVGGVLAILIVREVLSFLKTRKNGKNGEQHESIPAWYVKDTVTTALTKIAATLEAQEKILEDIRLTQREHNASCLKND